MGKQIGIVQSPKDERDLLNYLVSKKNLRCLPLETNDKSSLNYLSKVTTESAVLIVLEKNHDLILSQLKSIPNKRGFRLLPSQVGLSVAWCRTGKFKSGKTAPGRFYCDTSSPVSAEIAKETERVYSMLYRHVRSTYPRRAGERFLHYFGPDYCRLMDAGKVEYGLDYPIVPNPLFKS